MGYPMGEAGEVWNAVRDNRQEANAARYHRCVAQLAEYPYHVQQFNHGAHWRVDVLGVAFDFWPHTGKYRSQTSSPLVQGTATDFEDFIQRISRHSV